MYHTDQEIAEGLRQGDEAAYTQLYRNYYKSLCSYSYLLVKDHDTAEEIVQELIYKIWDKRKTLSFAPKLKTYMFRAVYNNSLQYIKKSLILSEDIDSSIKDNSFDEVKMDEAEMKSRINRSLSKLSHQSVEIFRMNRTFNYTYTEIAEKLNLSIKTIEYHISKVLKHLRSDLKDYLPTIILLLLGLNNFHALYNMSKQLL